MDALPEARRIVDDHIGEGPIALPELKESLERRVGLAPEQAVDTALAVLREYLRAGRIQVYRGRYLDDPAVVADAEAHRLLEQRSAYVYGDGDEIRTWFSVPGRDSS
jgi:hypothetical protein